MRHAGQKPDDPPRQQSRLPRAMLGLVALTGMSVATVAGWLPPELEFVYLCASALSWLVYSFDKAAAGRGARRTPEATLHLIDLLGGWPGGLVAQQQFRHKTLKTSFQAMFWLTVAVNVAIAGWLLWTGQAADL